MGKLMKYDLRAAMKLFVPLWLGTLVLALINSFTISSTLEQLNSRVVTTLQNLILTAYILAVVALVVVTLVFIVMRFYQSTVKDEAYLTFTLPVSVDAVAGGKALSGLVIFFGSVVVGLLSLLLLGRQVLFPDLLQAFTELFRRDDAGDLVLLGVLLLLLLLTTGLCSILRIYLSMALGQLAQKRKVAASVLAYMGIGLVINVLVTWFVASAQFGDNSFFDWLFFKGLSGVQSLWLLLGGLCLYNLVFCVIFYIPTRCLLKYQLNLE